MTSTSISSLSHADLVKHCTRLQEQLALQTSQIAKLTEKVRVANSGCPSPALNGAKTKDFDATRHSTRHIALRISYLGHAYNGFEHANRCFTPLPTIEEVLWKALRKARLISIPTPEGADPTLEVIHDPKERERRYYIHGKKRPGDDRRQRLDISWDGCQYSKCGRTDRGVSAFGQVIGIRVRSNRPVEKSQLETAQDVVQSEDELGGEMSGLDLADEDNESVSFDDIKDELPYLYMLNQLLPPDIRVLAWCPSPPPDFDARYSCLERRYKYFFTNPAFCPTPGPLGMVHASGSRAPVREGWLDIDAMRTAAKKLKGSHDYRNLCQIDSSKQMPSCVRKITFADVEEFQSGPEEMVISPHLNAIGDSAQNGFDKLAQNGPKVYTIVIHGSAFLWHQVRCIAAVLFLVGQGLESPDVIDQLLDIENTRGRPHYAMADDAPLVLWDCIFPEGDGQGLEWIYAGDQTGTLSLTAKGDGKFGPGGLIESLFTQWQEAKLKETQIGGLLSLVLAQGDQTSNGRGGFRDPQSIKARSQKIFEGSGQARLTGSYQPLMSRKRMDSLEVLNARYLTTVKGRRRQAKKNDSETI